MLPTRKLLLTLITVVICFIAIIYLVVSKYSFSLDIFTYEPVQPPKGTFLVTRVVDGDTIELENGEIVRYIGMDTPELFGREECFAVQAKQKNEELVLNKYVFLEKDVSETDRYARLLRYVYPSSYSMFSLSSNSMFAFPKQLGISLNGVQNNSTRIFNSVNYQLILHGYAYVSSYPPDVTYQEYFQQAQEQARKEKRGLWGSCE